MRTKLRVVAEGEKDLNAHVVAAAAGPSHTITPSQGLSDAAIDMDDDEADDEESNDDGSDDDINLQLAIAMSMTESEQHQERQQIQSKRRILTHQSLIFLNH